MRRAPSVLCLRGEIMFSPFVDGATVEKLLDDLRLEDVEGDPFRPATQSYRPDAAARQATIFKPASALGGGDGQDILDLARQHRQAFHGFQQFGDLGACRLEFVLVVF